jgi:hypothetical protein
MGDIDRGDTELALEVDDLGAGFGAQFGVQVGERLVPSKHLRFAGHCSPQSHPLLLAT